MADFIDLLSKLLATAEQNKKMSPHEIARQFTLEEGRARGGVEVIVVTDKHGQFLGAGTQDIPYSVDFPSALKERYQDPKADLIVHHNHPPNEEQFFSDTDMRGLAQNRGVGWMLMHTEGGYAAMRTSDKMFQPDASGSIPALDLPAAYRAGTRIAQHTMFNEGIHEDIIENAAPELALRALQQVGALQYYSSFKTGIGHEHEQQIIREIRSQSSNSPERSGGAAIWSGAEGTAVPPTSGGDAGAHRESALSDTPAIEVGFKRFVDIISRQNAAPPDPTKAGRPESPQLPETGGDHSSLASHRPTRGPLLESGQRPHLSMT